MIRPYLRDNKAPMKLRVYLGNEIIDYETQLGEWKIQCISIFFSSKDFEEIRIMSTKSDNRNYDR